MESNAVLGLVLATFLLAAMRGGIFYVFIANVAFSLLFPQEREIAGMKLDVSDLMLFTIAGGCLLSLRFAAPLRNRVVPRFSLWVVLGGLITISYMVTQGESMTDPARAAYQIYRYCWKPILFYPLVAALIQESPRRAVVLPTAIVVVGAVASVLHLADTQIAKAFFQHKNVFGGSLVAPAVLSVGLLLGQDRIFSRTWIVVTVAIIWGNMMLLGSRGAFVGAGFGAALLVLGMLRHTVGRARATRLALAAALLGVSVLAAFPQLMASKGVTMLAEMEEGTQVHTLQWRMAERWPHYIAMIKASPWVGTGQLYDRAAFKKNSKGAHNGYLSIALQRGVPACIIFFFIPFASALRARRVFRSRALPAQVRILVLASGAAIAGIMVHNLVEHSVAIEYTRQTLWTLSGLAGAVGLTAQRKTAGHRFSRAARLQARRVASSPRGQPQLTPQGGAVS